MPSSPPAAPLPREWCSPPMPDNFLRLVGGRYHGKFVPDFSYPESKTRMRVHEETYRVHEDTYRVAAGWPGFLLHESVFEVNTKVEVADVMAWGYPDVFRTTILEALESILKTLVDPATVRMEINQGHSTYTVVVRALMEKPDA